MTGFETSKTVVPLGRDKNKELILHQWKPLSTTSASSEEDSNDNDSNNTTCVAIVYHGFGAHANYPTVRYAAELLTTELGMTVYSADMEGHGESAGERGLLPTLDNLLDDAVSVAKHVLSLHSQKDGKNDASTTIINNEKKIMLVGSSMGGALSLHTSMHPDVAPHVAGLVLLAPLLSLNVSSVELMALQGLSYLIPDWAVIPSSSTSPEAQYRDDDRRAECINDKLSYSGKLKVQSALTCVELAERTKEATFLSSISSPFWLGIGTEDVVVKNDMAQVLFDTCATPAADKVMKSYAALHGLLCEKQPLRSQIEQELIAWVKHRTTC
jgi:alpha-beta hydrolase superfamily lysophospholipase